MSVKLKIGIVGCGYVGKAVAHFLKPYHFVTAFTRRANRLEELAACAHQVTLIEYPFRSLLEGQQVLIVTVAPSPRTSYQECYLKTAQAIADCLLKCPYLTQIIYTSSTSVYGEQEGAWVDENTLPNPQTEKESILLETEQIFLSLASKTCKICILRIGEIIGPGRELRRRFIEDAQAVFPGTGENFANLTPLDEIVKGITFAIDHCLEGIYNLCLDFHPTRKSLYEQICKHNHFPPPRWDNSQQAIRTGNKRVLCGKLKTAGYCPSAQELT